MGIQAVGGNEQIPQQVRILLAFQIGDECQVALVTEQHERARPGQCVSVRKIQTRAGDGLEIATGGIPGVARVDWGLGLGHASYRTPVTEFE